ncbi:MAG: hypothetical protein J0L62_02990 [Bacteroidetes bacterium]|nr:hypothetical protein [Bacteroidota bacterium]
MSIKLVTASLVILFVGFISPTLTTGQSLEGTYFDEDLAAPSYSIVKVQGSDKYVVTYITLMRVELDSGGSTAIETEYKADKVVWNKTTQKLTATWSKEINRKIDLVFEKGVLRGTLEEKINGKWVSSLLVLKI